MAAVWVTGFFYRLHSFPSPILHSSFLIPHHPHPIPHIPPQLLPTEELDVVVGADDLLMIIYDFFKNYTIFAS